MAATVPSVENIQSEFIIDDLMDLEIEELPVASHVPPANEVFSTSASGRLRTGTNFDLIQSSLRLRNFIPVKILCDQPDGTYVRQGYTFEAKVLLKPIAGLYGNFVGSKGGEK